jgi:polysaccharide biosynthesis transport protein
MYSSKEIVVNPAPFSPRPLLGPASLRNELSIHDLWQMLLRRKWIVIGTLLLFVGAAITICALSTRRYEAKASVQVQKESADALGLENMTGATESASDALDANITVQTQAQVLQSDSLALKVIHDLDLEHNADFQSKFSPIGWVLGFLSPKTASDPKNVPLEEQPGHRSAMVAVFRSNLKVKPVAGTRLIDVSYLNPDPRISAAVVNHLVQGLIDYNFQTRYNATAQAAGWLGNQLSDLRKESEDLQAKVVQLQRESGVFTLGQTDTQGREQVYTPVLDRLQQATAQLAQAQSSRIMKGALYQVVKDGDPELISGLAGNSLATASAGTSTSLGLIQSLRSQEAALQGQLNQLSAKFGPAYPKIAEVQADLDSIRKNIRLEGARVADRVKNDYVMSQNVENNARDVFTSEKQQADTLNDKAIEYQIVRQEAEQSRGLYESLLRRLKEAGVVAGLRSSNITIVDPARVPAKPAKPNPLLYIAGSLAAGLFFGTCGALMRDTMDNKIRDLPELEAYLGGAPLGILPYHRENLKRSRPQLAARGGALSLNAALPAIAEPGGPYAEALRSVRTSLMLSRSGAPPKVILVTSAVPGEGKTMLSSNLATLLAQQGKRVLLVDGDLRRPALHLRFNVKRMETGLSSLLTSDNIRVNAAAAPAPVAGVPGLHLLLAGPLPPYPAELLASDQMAEALQVWRREYDFIILDGAPVLPVTDSVLLHSQSDLTMVVARYKLTERQSLERAYSLLQAQGSGRIGVILNAVDRSANTYYQYFGYNNSSYYGSKQHA